MILETDGLVLQLKDEKPQSLELRLKQKIHMVMDGTYKGNGYGVPDYRISATGLVKDRATHTEVLEFLEAIQDNKVYYTDHHDVRWECTMDPDDQTLRRKSRECWTFSIKMIGVTV